MFGERGQISALVISDPIFPATENDANPFEGQPSHHRVVPLASLPLLLIVASRPSRVSDGMPRPLVKAPPQKLRTGPAKMYPLLFPTPFCHGRDPTVGLYFRGVGVTLPLRSKCRQQAWRQHRPRSRQRLKNKKIPDALPPPPRSCGPDPQLPG